MLEQHQLFLVLRRVGGRHLRRRHDHREVVLRSRVLDMELLVLEGQLEFRGDLLVVLRARDCLLVRYDLNRRPCLETRLPLFMRLAKSRLSQRDVVVRSPVSL